ncbi:dipeptidyl-peptidase-4 [Sphingomonas sp. UYAg733]
MTDRARTPRRSPGRIIRLGSILFAVLMLPAAARARDFAADDAAAEKYLRIDRLVANLDVSAHFVADGKLVLYHLGPFGSRRFMLADPDVGTARQIALEEELVPALAIARGRSIKPADIDARKIDWNAGKQRLEGEIDKVRWWYDPATRTASYEAQVEKPDGVVSPDGRFRVVAQNNNLVAIEIATGREQPLTTDGTADQPYGQGVAMLPDILREGTEQPKLPTVASWSADSRRIVTYRLDIRGVEPLTMTQSSPDGARYPRSFRYIYPTAGAPRVPLETPVIIDVATSVARKRAALLVPAVPPQTMLYPSDPDLGWEGDRVRYLWTERGYGQIVDFEIDPANGLVRRIARERVKPVVTITSTIIRHAPDMGGDLIVSERSGWTQLYFVGAGDPDGGVPLTLGKWEVAAIESIDRDDGVLITGTGREPGVNLTWRAFYRIRPGAQPQLLTPEPLDHEVTVSPDRRWFLDAMSSPTEPTRTLLRRASDGKIMMELARADPAALLASGFTPPEPFAIQIEGTTLYGMLYRPRRFDHAQRYPVLDNVYTGPTTSNVPATYGGTIRNAANSIAQLGIVVAQIDGRGTSLRGQAFRLPAWRNLGEVGLDDHIAVLRAMAVRYPSLDLKRVGAYGFSAGGYDAARFILRRPDFFTAALAGAGNHDLRLDKAWWPEVSMGLADDATWERNSNIAVAGQLKGKLMLVHGEIDDNVPVAATYRLAKALSKAQKPFELVILPDTAHRVYQPFFWLKARDFFRRALLIPGDAQ